MIPSIRMRALVVPACGVALLTAATVSADVLRPVSERFATRNTTEPPSFQRHVVPLLGRLGCNGRACHGSFQGRGGFRLSLFGHDLSRDHAALTDEATSTNGDGVDREHRVDEEHRVDRANPARSLILRKPSLEVKHEGGRRFRTGSWEHHLLLRWAEAGALLGGPRSEIEALEVAPAEVVFAEKRQTVRLRVVARWKDGSREDVTDLSRFRSNDDSIVEVSAGGELRSRGAGDTHVVVFYDNGVVAVPVMRPFTGDADQPRETARARTEIDRLVESKLDKLGIVPSRLSTDSEFLRRLSIDVTGTLPEPREVLAFLADERADKRSRKIDELLERPSYAAWWANKLCDYTGCNPSQQAELGQEVSVQWYSWIAARLRENRPYDEIVRRIVLAKGRREGQSFDEYVRETSAYFDERAPADFTTRDTMPHYWSRRTLEKPEDKALAFAHSFLGIRLQCAQCHKHPWAPWSQDDFQQFSRFFETVRFGLRKEDSASYRTLAQQVGLAMRGADGSAMRGNVFMKARMGTTVPWREVYISRRDKPVELELLRDRRVTLRGEEDPREKILEWMLEPGNPWFATAIVNRVWAGYFHVGIIEPPDDLQPANPPSNPELLDWLTRGFVASGYDLKWLHRAIVSSDAYQRSWRPNETNREDRRNFSRAIPRRLPAEIVYDGLKQVVASKAKSREVRLDLSRRAIGHLSMRLAGTYSMRAFGKPDRAVNCDCERVNKPTLLQAVFLQNDPLVEQRLEESGWLQEVEAAEKSGEKADRRALVREAWLRALGREPSDEEVERGIRHLEEEGTTTGGLRDLLWALINTREFILNH